MPDQTFVAEQMHSGRIWTQKPLDREQIGK